jgi:hypothetical protein
LPNQNRGPRERRVTSTRQTRPQVRHVLGGRADVDDEQPATAPQQPHRLVDRLRATLGVGDVVDREAAEH